MDPSAAERRQARAQAKARAQELLGLFAWHRDGTGVARALGVSLDELTAELDALKIRRRAFALTRGTDMQLPKASSKAGPSGPSVRRRTAAQRAQPKPAADPLAGQTAELKALLAEVGPRRDLLAQKLGLSDAALLARF